MCPRSAAEPRRWRAVRPSRHPSGRAPTAFAATAAVLAALLAAPAARAEEEEPSFWITYDTTASCGDVNARTNVEVRYELCDDWPQPGAGSLAGPGEKASRSRSIFRHGRGLKGMGPGSKLLFCKVSGSGGGSDSGGSSATMSITEDGGQYVTGVEVSESTRRPFSNSSGSGSGPRDRAPRDLPGAELVRTAKGARLIVPPGEDLATGGYGYFGCASYFAMDKTLQEHQAYSTFELTEQDLATFSDLTRARRVSISNEAGDKVSIAFSVRARLPDLGQVLVEAEGYDDWRPEGSLARPTEPGNQLVVRARVVQATGPDGKSDEKSDRRVKLTFELKDVSEHSGVCNNGPVEGFDDRPDLRLLQARNPAFEVVKEATAKTRELVNEATLTVSSYDYGAWGRLTIKAVDSKGRAVPVTIKGREGRKGADLLLPKDDDGNRIADVWDQRRGVSGLASNDDGDPLPAGNGFAGDGLTLYEEYRGFQVRGEWADTDPKRKDLFICDESSAAKGGIALFAVATDLDVHVVTCGELGADRVINRFTVGSVHLAAQRGLRIIDGPPGTDAENRGTGFGPPRTSSRVVLPQGGLPADAGPRTTQDWEATVAHELGHGVGLQHHGDLVFASILQWVEQPDGRKVLRRWEADPETRTSKGSAETVQVLYEATGLPWKAGDPTPPGFGPLDAGRYITYELGLESPSSGEETCFMRYQDRGLWLSRARPGTEYIPDRADWMPRKVLCASPKGTGVNGPDHRPESRYGDAIGGRGDCRHRFVVNDRYTGP